VVGCGGEVHGLGLCLRHHRRVFEGRPLDDAFYPVFDEHPERRACSVPSCTRVKFCRGWCKAHYQRWYAHGDVFADVPVIPRRGGGVGGQSGC
jgi:hypothetical protein